MNCSTSVSKMSRIYIPRDSFSMTLPIMQYFNITIGFNLVLFVDFSATDLVECYPIKCRLFISNIIVDDCIYPVCIQIFDLHESTRVEQEHP